MNLLLDTNIAIALDPLGPEGVETRTPAAIELSRLAVEAGDTLFVHPASFHDINRDADADRRETRRLLLGKYPVLTGAPSVPGDLSVVLGVPASGTNDWVDNELIAAVVGNAVDYLVTDDDGIHRKARRSELSERVLTVADAALLLQSLRAEFVALPQLRELRAYELDAQDPLFRSIQEEYGEEFGPWLEQVKLEHRPCLAIEGTNGELEGLAILKHDDDEFGMTGRVMKLSTFKVAEAHRGNRYGELLAHGVVRYARDLSFDAIWVSVFSHHAALIGLFENMGFFDLGVEKEPGERVFGKRLTWTAHEWEALDPFDFAVTFGPGAIKFDSSTSYFVPIQPGFHRALFPEGEAPAPLLVEAFGNAVRKAYLCNAPIRSIERGDVLLFYRSGDAKAVTVVGVVEDVLVARDPDVIRRFVGNRTVYSDNEIKRLCASEVLVILFRFDRMIADPIPLEELKDNGALLNAPQTTMSVRSEGVAWLASRI